MEAQADQDAPSPTKCDLIIYSLWTPPSMVISFEHLCYDNLQSDCKICRVQFGKKKKKFHGSKFFSKAQSWLVRGTIQLGELYTNLLFPWKSQFQAVLREAGDTELLCSPNLAAPRAVGTEMEHKASFYLLPPASWLLPWPKCLEGITLAGTGGWEKAAFLSQTGLGWNLYSTIN